MVTAAAVIPWRVAVVMMTAAADVGKAGADRAIERAAVSAAKAVVATVAWIVQVVVIIIAHAADRRPR